MNAYRCSGCHITFVVFGFEIEETQPFCPGCALREDVKEAYYNV